MPAEHNDTGCHDLTDEGDLKFIIQTVIIVITVLYRIILQIAPFPTLVQIIAGLSDLGHFASSFFLLAKCLFF